jgi:hypothetical protein
MYVSIDALAILHLGSRRDLWVTTAMSVAVAVAVPVAKVKVS